MKKTEKRNLKSEKKTREISLEEMYLSFFTTPAMVTLETNRNPLKVPSIYQDVDTVTTYGAYEKPISCQIGITS